MWLFAKVIVKSIQPSRNHYLQRNKNRGPFFDRNDYIRPRILRVVDSSGENLGEMERDRAIQIARSQELDLVLIAPNTEPPVARIMSWTKFKYEQSKKKRDNKGKKTEVKEMWFKPKIEEGDIAHKVERISEFISKGDRVKITIRGQGRVTPLDLRKTLARVMEKVNEFAVQDTEAKQEGRNLIIFVRRK